MSAGKSPVWCRNWVTRLSFHTRILIRQFKDLLQNTYTKSIQTTLRVAFWWGWKELVDYDDDNDNTSKNSMQHKLSTLSSCWSLIWPGNNLFLWNSAVFTTIHQRTLSWAKWIQSTLHFIKIRFNSIHLKIRFFHFLRLKFWNNFSSLPRIVHVPPISFLSIWSA
jgi:hypothetical protein